MWDTPEQRDDMGITPASTIKYLLKMIDAEIIEYTRNLDLLTDEVDRVNKHLALLQARRRAAQHAQVVVRGTAT